MMKLSITTFQYPTTPFITWEEYKNKVTAMISHAVEQGANLVLFAEYAGLDLINSKGDLFSQINVLQSHIDDYVELFRTLAYENEIYIIPGTQLIKLGNEDVRNRAFIFSPNQEVNYQDKMNLTPAEREQKIIKPGTDLKVFETHYGKIAIAICYDSEFPLLVHQQVQAGAELIIVPTCTDSLLGFTRVNISSRARAIENQCYVAQSCLINTASTCDFIDTNVGQSGVYSPADLGFPDNGIMAETAFNEEGSVTIELDGSKLDFVRKSGQVTNFHDFCKSGQLPLVLTKLL